MMKPLYVEDAYLQFTRAEVVSCKQGENGYEVCLSQTVLYPEGGGQPWDRGWIDDQEVLDRIEGDDGSMAYVIERPVEGEVEVRLDWERRFDHMQQHTAQHMITAVAADGFGMNTTAFHLGRERSDIELDTPGLSAKQKAAIEKKVNNHIAASLLVTSRFVESSALQTEAIRTRGLPDGFSGSVRLVEIEGVDTNTCGGTHVANTSELQAVKLLHTEHLRGGTRLFFVAGKRMLLVMEQMLLRERAMTKALSCSPEEHAQSLDRIQDELKAIKRRERSLKRELAIHAGKELAQPGTDAVHHRPDGDMEFLRAMAEAARKESPDALFLLFSGESSGVFLVAGPGEKVKDFGSTLTSAAGLRGGGKGELFQGKYASTDQREKAVRCFQQR